MTMENRKRIAFHNLGCKVNGYETESMLRRMAEAGYEIVPFAPGADVYVINTCTVTNIADRKSRQMLHRAKAMNSQALVVAVGCYAQVAGESLQADEAVDLIIGNDEKSRLAELIQERLKGCGDDYFVSDIRQAKVFEELGGSGGDHARAYMKIEDGCNQFCSYCLIPHARGRVRSRTPENALAEAKRLVAEGYREIVLTGIHMASYGLDFVRDAGDHHAYGMPLAGLIEEMSHIPGLERIRLGSLEPRLINQEFARRLAAVPQLCPHFHLSLQSGSDTVLARMNRHYTAEDFRQEVEILRTYFERPALTTDVIVGFPGESLQEFEDSRRFLEEVDFYQAHVFRYSRRKGTPADTMPNQIPEGEKARRSALLIEDGRRRQQRFERGLIGSERWVLLEEPVPGREGLWRGHTPEYVELMLPAPAGGPGVMISVKVTEEMLGHTEEESL